MKSIKREELTEHLKEELKEFAESMDVATTKCRPHVIQNKAEGIIDMIDGFGLLKSSISVLSDDKESEIRFPPKIYLTDQAVSRMLDLTEKEREETVEWEYAFASKQNSTNWSFLSTVEHREEIRNETARCIAIAQKQLEEKDKEIEDLKKQLTIKKTSYDNLKELLGEICEEWNEDCDADCSSWGHTGTCKKINIAEAKKAMRLKIEGLEERFKTAIETLEELTVALEMEADFHGHEPHQLTQKARQELDKAKKTENE